MADSRDDQLPEVKTETSDTSERQKDFTRRALLRAGWVVPAVTAINIPSASAQTPTPHNDTHGDAGHGDNIIEHLTSTWIRRSPRTTTTPTMSTSPHADTPHTDVPHSDAPHTDAPHSDTPPHTDVPHSDTPPHTDNPHADVPTPHTDVPHTDTPPHTDVPHTDTPPHTDVPHTDTPPHTDVPHSDTPAHTDVPHSDTPSHGDHADAATHVDVHSDNHGDHGDHSDVHGDVPTFNDHTDLGHADHADTVFHTDHLDTAPHARSYGPSSGPGHLDTPPQHPPHSDHWDVRHRDHDDNGPSASPPGTTTTGMCRTQIIWIPAIAITPIRRIRITLMFPTRMDPLTTTTPTSVHIDTHGDSTAAYRRAWRRARRPGPRGRAYRPLFAYRRVPHRRQPRRRPWRLGAGGHGRPCRYPRRFDPVMTGAEDASSEKEGVVADGRSVPRRIAAEEFVQDGECLLYNPSRDEASALNRTATEVWLLCDGRLTLSGIAGVLGERYGVDEAMLLDDVALVLAALRARGLIEWLPGSPQS